MGKEEKIIDDRYFTITKIEENDKTEMGLKINCSIEGAIFRICELYGYEQQLSELLT